MPTESLTICPLSTPQPHSTTLPSSTVPQPSAVLWIPTPQLFKLLPASDPLYWLFICQGGSSPDLSLADSSHHTHLHSKITSSVPPDPSLLSVSILLPDFHFLYTTVHYPKSDCLFAYLLSPSLLRWKHQGHRNFACAVVSFLEHTAGAQCICVEHRCEYPQDTVSINSPLRVKAARPLAGVRMLQASSLESNLISTWPGAINLQASQVSFALAVNCNYTDLNCCED